MPAQTPNQAKVELAQSFNTSTVDEDIYEFGQPAPHVDFQGIERDGGLMNVYIESYIGDSACGKPVPTSIHDSYIPINAAMLPGIRRRISFPDNTVDVVAYPYGNASMAAYGTLYRMPDGNLWTQDCYANGAVVPNTQQYFCPSYVANITANGIIDNPAIVRPAAGMFDPATTGAGIGAICGVNSVIHSFALIERDPSYANVNSMNTAYLIDVDARVFTPEAKTTQTQGFGSTVGIPGVNLGTWHQLSPTNYTTNFSSYARLLGPGDVRYYPGVGYMAPMSNGAAYCTAYHVNTITTAVGVPGNMAIGYISPANANFIADPMLANINFTQANAVRTQLSYFSYFEGSFLANQSGTNVNVHILADEGGWGNTATFGLDDSGNGAAWTYPDITQVTIDPEADYTIASGALVVPFYPGAFQNTEGPITNIRTVFIQDLPAALSINSVPITAPGEIDPTYYPMVQQVDYSLNATILYRLTWKGIDGRFYAVEVGRPNPGDKQSADGVLPTYQKMADDLYKYNTLQPVSIYDVKLGRSYVGPTDWNNRFIVYAPYIAAGARGTVSISSAVNSDHASGYWAGEKVIKNCRTDGALFMPLRSLYLTGGEIQLYRDASSTVSATYGFPVRFYKALRYDHSADCSIPTAGVLSPVVGLTVPNSLSVFGYGVDVYRDVVTTYVDQLYADTDYNASSIQNYGQVPMVAGCLYNPRVAYDGGRNTTYVRDDAYDSYLAGNEIPAFYDTFELFGSIYGFDGEKIQQLIIDGTGTVNALRPMASAVGLSLIAKAPTMAWFLSAFDNSLYTFDGGRDLAKKIRLNKLSAVRSAVWSTKENSLVIDTTNDLLFMRDGIISRLPKALYGTPGAWLLYDTTGGVQIRDPLQTAGFYINGFRILYTPTANSTILPVVLQTAYFGFDKNTRATVQNAVVTVMTDSPTTANVSFYTKVDSFDQDNHYSDEKYMTVSPYVANSPVGSNAIMWSNTGYARLRITPSRSRSLGTSITVATGLKVRILDITWNFIGDGQATIQNSR